MIGRVLHSLLALAIVLDVVVCGLWLALLYPFNLADKPNGHQTISGYVGKAALHGNRWAFGPERLIDRVFGQGHCLRAYQRGQG